MHDDERAVTSDASPTPGADAATRVDHSPTTPPEPVGRPKTRAARLRHPAARIVTLTRRMALQRAGLAFSAHVQRDPLSQLFLRGGRGDPFDTYERFRAAGPITRTRSGFHVATGHAACSELLTSRSVGVRPVRGDAFEVGVDLSLLELDPPEHTRLRRLAAPAFTRRRLERYRRLVESTIDRLLREAPAHGVWDLVAGYASPLPIAVITAMLGIPAYDEPAFRRFGAAIADALDGVRSPVHAAQVVGASRTLDAIFARLFELRRREPADDVVSSLVQAHDGGGIAPEDMTSLCTLLLVAGFETTVNLISNAVLTLQAHPQQWERLVADPTLAAGAIEETLRYAPPVHLTGRYPHEEIDVAGTTLRPGDGVIVFLAAAGRDPDVFDDPGRYDITRADAADHLAFSAGAHYCLGAPLARLEATLALEALATRMPGLRLAGGPTWRPGVTVRGPARLPVRAR